jgi:hypothetical protein
MSDPDTDTGRGKSAALGADLVIPVMALCFTVYFLIDAAPLVWEARANGTVIGVVLLTLVAIQFVRTALRWRAGDGTFSFGEIGEWNESQAKRLALFAILAVFIATIPWLGTTLGVFFVMLTSMWVLGMRDWRSIAGIAFVAAASVYILFIAFLQTQLPRGLIENTMTRLFGIGA